MQSRTKSDAKMLTLYLRVLCDFALSMLPLVRRRGFKGNCSRLGAGPHLLHALHDRPIAGGKTRGDESPVADRPIHRKLPLLDLVGDAHDQRLEISIGIVRDGLLRNQNALVVSESDRRRERRRRQRICARAYSITTVSLLFPHENQEPWTRLPLTISGRRLPRRAAGSPGWAARRNF